MGNVPLKINSKYFELVCIEINKEQSLIKNILYIYKNLKYIFGYIIVVNVNAAILLESYSEAGSELIGAPEGQVSEGEGDRLAAVVVRCADRG